MVVCVLMLFCMFSCGNSNQELQGMKNPPKHVIFVGLYLYVVDNFVS